MSVRTGPYGPKNGPCAVCGRQGVACGRCRVDFYCGKLHQNQHWPQHRKGCGVYEVRTNAELGRYLVATKDIPPGTIIMRETPLVVLPRHYERLEPMHVCVGCHKELLPGREKRCSKCGWVVCNATCSKSKLHAPECAVFQRAQFKLQNRGMPEEWEDYGLSALRIWCASREEPQGSFLRGLQSEWPSDVVLHDKDDFALVKRLVGDRMTSYGKTERAIRWLRDEVGVDWVPQEELRRWLGVRCINASLYEHGVAGIATLSILAGGSLLEHSCSPSAVVMPVRYMPPAEAPVGVVVIKKDLQDPEGLIAYNMGLNQVAKATDPYECGLMVERARPGDHLTLCYRTSTSMSRTHRRTALLWWGFLCRCRACLGLEKAQYCDPETYRKKMGQKPCPCPDCR